METKTSQPDREAQAIHAKVLDVSEEAGTITIKTPAVDEEILSMVNQYFESNKEMIDGIREQFMAMNAGSVTNERKTPETEAEGCSAENRSLSMEDEVIRSGKDEIDILAKEDNERMTDFMGYHNDIPDTVMIDLEARTRVMRNVAHADMRRRVTAPVVPEAQFVYSGPRDGMGIDIPPAEELYSYLGSLNRRGLAGLASVNHSNNVSSDALQRTKAFVDIGDLNKLPFELTLNVLSLLDMFSMTVVRVVNRSCKGIVDAYFPNYKDLLVHASANVLRVIQAVNLSPQPSINQIYAILCSDRCVICNGFGTYIFLLTGSRCCFPCLESAPELRAITKTKARHLFGLRNEEMSELPTMTSLPGVYTLEYRYQDAESLVGFQAALDLGMQLNGTRRRMLDFGVRIWAEEAPWQLTAPANISHQRITHENFLIHYMDKFRGMASIPFPFVDIHHDQVEDGISCLGCAVEERWWTRTQQSKYGRYNYHSNRYVRRRYKVYTRAEFSEHLEVCKGAKDLWEERR